jgi:hypothetical protein
MLRGPVIEEFINLLQRLLVERPTSAIRSSQWLIVAGRRVADDFRVADTEFVVLDYAADTPVVDQLAASSLEVWRECAKY